MFTTRRRFATLASSLLGSVTLLRGLPAFARGEDDGPPNVFFSPHGRPYRAVAGAPYPVADWFNAANRNGDGKLDQAEFLADAEAFFNFLDLNGAGALGPDEISFYEHNIAPEVLGMRVMVLASGELVVKPAGARLWLAQSGPFEGGPMQDNVPEGGMTGLPGNPGGYSHGGDPNQGNVLPDDVTPNAPPPKEAADELRGAAPYGFFREPEPVTAADPDYLFSGVVKKERFLAHARDNFARLDAQKSGYLTLAGLPQSSVEQQLGARGRKS